MWKTLRNYAQIWIYVDINVDEQLNILYLPPLALFWENLYKNRFLKIMSNGHHQLHSFIPERQSGCRLHSAARLIKDSFFTTNQNFKEAERVFHKWFYQVNFCFWFWFFMLKRRLRFFCSVSCFMWCHLHLNSGM